MAAHADRSYAVAVAEHTAVHLGSELAHLGAFGISGKGDAAVLLFGGCVERFDLLADFEVLVSNGSVCDARRDHCHAHRLVTEQRCDGFEAHATVDRLGREGVSKLVRRDTPDPGGLGRSVDDRIDPVLWPWTSVVVE